MTVQQLGAAVDDALAEADRRGLAVNGIVVDSPGGRVERSPLPDIRRDIFSLSKTVTSLAVGIAVDEGRLALGDAMLDLLPGFRAEAAPGVERITVRHLLTMTSGIVYRWEHPDFDHDGDPAAEILATPLGFEPGTGFAYRGGSTYLLSRILRAATGEDLRDFLLPRLFRPLGIGNPQWQRCPLGFSMGAVGLELRTGEIARIGRMLLDGGRVEDRQLVPADWVAAMPVDHTRLDGRVLPHDPFIVTASGYGLGVWLCGREDAWRMDGYLGQFCVIVPNRRACVTVTAQYGGDTTDILDLVWDRIITRL